jgi:glycosyltransferase involved in cell wall biosynthesis
MPPTESAVRSGSALTEITNVSASSKPVRVLHVNSGNLYGGVETILVTLARLRHLCPSMEPHFAVCHEGRLSEELRAAGVPVYVLGRVRISRPWTVWRARRRLREILRHEHFTLTICHMPWNLAVFGTAVRKEGQQLGFWAHAFHSGNSILERLAKRATPDIAIANSRFTEAGITNVFSDDVLHAVVYPPVALTEKGDFPRWRSTVRKERGVSDDTAVIIQVSRIEKGKGHSLHLRALAQLKEISSPWTCWMVGGAQRPEEEQYLFRLRRDAERLGLAERIHFFGQRADVSKLLASADIFCQPNESPDSFGIVFVEALWAGLPVVTTALGAAKEVIDGSCGFVIDPGNPKSLAESLRRLIEDPKLRSGLGSAGRGRAVSLCEPGRQMKLLGDFASRVSEQS